VDIGEKLKIFFPAMLPERRIPCRMKRNCARQGVRVQIVVTDEARHDACGAILRTEQERAAFAPASAPAF
jgi:hypothetical protein